MLSSSGTHCQQRVNHPVNLLLSRRRESHRVGVQYRLDHFGAAVVVDDVKSARGVRRVRVPLVEASRRESQPVRSPSPAARSVTAGSPCMAGRISTGRSWLNARKSASTASAISSMAACASASSAAPNGE